MSDSGLLELKQISKSFPGVKALKEVNFHIKESEIVSLVGVNGAGKSTLSHIISGIYPPDSGEILINGKDVAITNVNIADNLGIGIVHQEPTLVPNMTAAANIFLNRELSTKTGMLDTKKMNSECKRVLDMLGYNINLKARISSMTLVEKTIIEIAKAMLLNPCLLILDEVTAPLNKNEVEHFFKIIMELRNKKLAIIFISHRIQEIMRISDRVAVLRDGQLVSELNRGSMSEKEIIKQMLGESGEFKVTGIGDGENMDRKQAETKDLLELKNLTVSKYFRDFSLTLKEGEIVGLAGLKGAGITELLKTVFGRIKPESGGIVVKGKKIEIDSTTTAIRDAGIGFITNDRQNEGLALIRNVNENISISALDLFRNSFKILRKKDISGKSKDYVSELSIKTPSINQEVRNLSGGNQQKIVIAKWLLCNLDILLIDEPTRGVDIRAKNDIYRLLLDLSRKNKGIIVTSPEIPELLNICDRILVVVHGKIACEVKKTENGFNEANILELMHKESVPY
ncbi:MAG: sugar ABC transporter ATP-binding protein [Treponema sp.]|jgi:ABC-type sugar transport system ATPase subunit|nr:sugar ABC transporter ATP-binding protein [Treponema sp.]